MKCCVEERAKCGCSCHGVRVPLLGANSKTFLLSAKLFAVSSLVLPCQSLVQFLVTPKSASNVSVQLRTHPSPPSRYLADSSTLMPNGQSGLLLLEAELACLLEWTAPCSLQVLLSPSLDSSSSWQLPELSLGFLISCLRPPTSRWSFSSLPCHPWNLDPSHYSRHYTFHSFIPCSCHPSCLSCSFCSI